MKSPDLPDLKSPDLTTPDLTTHGVLRVVGDGEDLSSPSPTYRASERR